MLGGQQNCKSRNSVMEEDDVLLSAFSGFILGAQRKAELALLVPLFLYCTKLYVLRIKIMITDVEKVNNSPKDWLYLTHVCICGIRLILTQPVHLSAGVFETKGHNSWHSRIDCVILTLPLSSYSDFREDCCGITSETFSKVILKLLIKRSIKGGCIDILIEFFIKPVVFDLFTAISKFGSADQQL